MNNYECLEVLGDSALKFITSTSLFLLLNDRGEDAMTNYRTAMIRNSYLKVLPVASNISNFITTKMYYSKYFENFVNEKAIIDN
jgi:dsRNA-specific ribonuclease